MVDCWVWNAMLVERSVRFEARFVQGGVAGWRTESAEIEAAIGAVIEGVYCAGPVALDGYDDAEDAEVGYGVGFVLVDFVVWEIWDGPLVRV